MKVLLRPTLAVVALAFAAAACTDPIQGVEPDGGPGPDGAVPGVDAAPPDPGSEYVFDDDELRTYEVVLDDADWQWLQDNALLEQYVQGTLYFEGQEIAPIGVRYKGGFGTLNSCFDDLGNNRCPKLSMKLKFNEYDEEQRFYGLKRLNFHSMIADPSALKDRLAYSLYRDMGVNAPRAVHARLIVNDELLGLFALVEQVDGRFSRMNFPDGGEGNVYKEVWPIHLGPGPYLDALKTNEDEGPDVSRMIAFATAIAGATDATIEDVLSEWTDLDALMNYLAVDRAIENWDGIVGFWCVSPWCGNHNYYFYEETTRDKVWLIPWDLDNTFHVPNPFVETYGQPEWDVVTASCEPVPIFEIDGQKVGRRPATCDPLIRWMATTLRGRYIAASETLLDGPYSPVTVGDKLDRWAQQIADAVAEDPNGPTPQEWNWALQDLHQSVNSLRADIEAVVGRQE